jgi:hypothetical protein
MQQSHILGTPEAIVKPNVIFQLHNVLPQNQELPAGAEQFPAVHCLSLITVKPIAVDNWSVVKRWLPIL